MLPDNLCIIHSSLWLREWQNPGQATLIGFLGLDLDTEAMEICLPQAKLDHLRSIVTAWRGRKACRK